MAAQTDDPSRRALRTVQRAWSTLARRLGGCADAAGPPAEALTAAACTVRTLSRRLRGQDEALAHRFYDRQADAFARFGDALGLFLAEGDEESGFDASFVAPHARDLQRSFTHLARSADEGDVKGREELQEALAPLYEVAAEFGVMAEILMSTPPGPGAAAITPYLSASLVAAGQGLSRVAFILPIAIGLPFGDPFCPDKCTCGTATGKYVLSGFNVYTVQGGLRKVVPQYTITACCEVSCYVISSQCVNLTVSKEGAVPDRLAITSRGNVNIAKGQIRAAVRGKQLAPPTFAAGDCP